MGFLNFFAQKNDPPKSTRAPVSEDRAGHTSAKGSIVVFEQEAKVGIAHVSAVAAAERAATKSEKRRKTRLNLRAERTSETP